MLSTSLTVGDKPYVITAVVTLCGHDAVIAVGGGEAPHVGAAALASSRPSLEQNGGISATASVLCVMGHKDDLLARDAAMRLASRLNTTVLVSVGLHVDQATKEDIRQLQVNFEQLIGQIESWLRQQK
ncbi:prenylated flavin chaperone LpdD [Propionispora hippei]|uniref:Prenylated flavin chaperone LpdD-like domain-containing protein n=1 Tax=Propionispora hippei DSM 15287 TaxID=1123003 RepID=A0A1M6KSI8_9FIRM|nr:hypothetical protein [Propionispora hippei]SHJ61928.1 hypothetical protein SAMN02745170_02938 [Propionispora hippei DSM 15287]